MQALSALILCKLYKLLILDSAAIPLFMGDLTFANFWSKKVGAIKKRVPNTGTLF